MITSLRDFDISFFSVIMLLALYAIVRHREIRVSSSGRLFYRIIWVTIYMLLLEILSWQFDQKPGKFNYYANYITNMLFAWSTPLVTCCWVSYIDYHMFSSYDRLKKRLFYLYPMIVNTLFIGMNFFHPLLFSVSKDNVYRRESYIWLLVILNVLAHTYLCVMAFKNKDRIRKEVIRVILLLIIAPSLASMLQLAIYGIFIMWPVMALTIMLVYIFLETNSTSKDHLTGLTSRKLFDNYIEYHISKNKPFGLIMIDLDKFKEINDTLGHIEGDKALQIFSDALRSIFSKTDIIARYAGDEFIIMTDELDAKSLDRLRKLLKSNLDKEVRKNSFPVQFGFSMGYQKWDGESSYKDMIRLADRDMYSQKRMDRQNRI